MNYEEFDEKVELIISAMNLSFHEGRDDRILEIFNTMDFGDDTWDQITEATLLISIYYQGKAVGKSEGIEQEFQRLKSLILSNAKDLILSFRVTK